MENTITLDDVGKRIEVMCGGCRLKNRTVGVVMAIVAPNGDHCAIFERKPLYQKTQKAQAKAIRAFMGGHRG